MLSALSSSSRCTLFAASALALSLAGCASAPTVVQTAAPAPRTAPAGVEVYVYPRAGQSPAQEKLDRFQCYQQAVASSGLDPSRLPANPAPSPTWKAVPSPVAGNTIAMATTGALIGSAVGSSGQRTGAALAGMMIGTVLGAITDSNLETQAQHVAAERNYYQGERDQRSAELIEAYRSSMIACLEARDYSAR